jgi:ATP-dependent Clp protease ATP-binding subunit ClpA
MVRQEGRNVLSKELEQSLNDAFREARREGYEFLSVELMLLALLGNEKVRATLTACGVGVDALSLELREFVDNNSPRIGRNSDHDIEPTLGFQRVLQRAVLHMQSAGLGEIYSPNVVVAIFGEKESHAVYLLQKHGLTRAELINQISHGEPQKFDNSERESSESSEDERVVSNDPLRAYATNLNEAAMEGRIDPLIGRREEVDRTIQILCRRRKNNPLYVGEAGVGKTAIAEGLARLIVEESVPQILLNATVYSLDLGALVAGTKYRGDFEKRLKLLLARLHELPDSILFIDEIHTIIGAGSASGGTMDASNLIKPLLASGDLRCIGSTTYQEYRTIFEKDHALARRFQKIDIREPSVEETFQILRGLKSRFEEHHEARYTVASLRAAAELSARYLNDRHLPDKAIDVIDEAGARLRLRPPSRRRKSVGVGDIEEIIAGMARIPTRSVSTSDMEALRQLDRNLKMVIFGQDPAIDTLTTAIRMSRSGLVEGDRPVGSFLFAGPTGVGKTEVTRQLSKILGIELIRFDMSEYMERHTVSRLIGAPPGYVGFDQGGLLTEAIVKHPHAVVLLDEIEKAHPDLFNLLLQVMDHGTLTDNNGRKADFRNVILVMTSNIGASETGRPSIGFTSQDHSSDIQQAIRRGFSPEFRNRLDAIVHFAPLSSESINHVVDKFLIELETLLEPKGVELVVTEAARSWLAGNGYDPAMGARPMARLIRDHLKRPLADELLFGKLTGGGVARIDCDGEKIRLELTTASQMEEDKSIEA